MQYIGAVDDATRCACLALQQVVVVAVYAGNHMSAQSYAEVVHHRHLLTLSQRCVRGQHHLEVVFFVVVLAQQMAPERHVVVALHIGHNPLACRLGFQAVGGFYVERGYVLCQSLSHNWIPPLPFGPLLYGENLRTAFVGVWRLDWL